MADATPAEMAIPEPSSVSLEHVTASLAFELARQMVPWQQTIARFGITEDEFRILLQNPNFQKLVREAKATWESTANIAERTRLKAQFALETCLLPMHTIVHDPKAGTQARIDATKLLSSIAGMHKTSDGTDGGKGFVLNINLGEKTISVQPSGPAVLDQSSG